LAGREYSTEAKDPSKGDTSKASNNEGKRGPINSDPKRGGFQSTRGGYSAAEKTGNTNFRRSPDLTFVHDPRQNPSFLVCSGSFSSLIRRLKHFLLPECDERDFYLEDFFAD
jgi:hypothetical protein